MLTGIQIYQGRGKYYILDGEKYDIHFPLHWAMCHKGTNPKYPDENAGPKECLNCKDNGSINNVFVAYCSNCSHYAFDGTREGCGFDEIALESFGQMSYMNGVLLSEIGDGNENTEEYYVDVIEDGEILEDESEFEESVEPNYVTLDDRMKHFNLCSSNENYRYVLQNHFQSENCE